MNAQTSSYQLDLPFQPKVEVVRSKNKVYTVLEVLSSDGTKSYRVDVTNQRCSCPAWKFSGGRRLCKHLKSLGFTELVAKAKAEKPVNQADGWTYL